MPAVLRSLLSSMVEPRHMGTLNSLIGVLEMLGLMIAAPVLFGSLSLGFEWGGAWTGLPFICAAAIISVATAIIWFLPIRGQEDPAGSSHEAPVC
jgi:MFS family permease